MDFTIIIIIWLSLCLCYGIGKFIKSGTSSRSTPKKDIADKQEKQKVDEASSVAFVQRPAMSERAIADVLTTRFVQLRLALEGLFLEQGIQYKFIDIDDVDYRDDSNIDRIRPSEWFRVVLTIIVFDKKTNERHIIYVTMHGHIARLKNQNPQGVVDRIESIFGDLYTKMSNKDDIIAYYRGTPSEIIELILGQCNAAAMPRY